MINQSNICTIYQLNENTCRWPITTDEGTMYCGNQPLGKLPYCAMHCRIAYQADVQKRVRDRPSYRR